MKSKEEGKKGKTFWFNYHTLPQMKLCGFNIIFASMHFLTTLGGCIKTQASVLTAGYMEGREICIKFTKPP